MEIRHVEGSEAQVPAPTLVLNVMDTAKGATRSEHPREHKPSRLLLLTRGIRGGAWPHFECSIEVLSPVLTRVLGSATQEEVNMPLRPYQRMGKSVSASPSLPTSLLLVM